MRRRSVCLFLKRAPGGVLRTLEVFPNTSEDPESLRNFDQGETSWLPLVLWVTTQEHLVLSTLRKENREKETENERLGVQAKAKKYGKKLSLPLFMSFMHDTFTARIFLDVWFIYRWECSLTVGYVPKAATVSIDWVYVPPESMERKFNKR